MRILVGLFLLGLVAPALTGPTAAQAAAVPGVHRSGPEARIDHWRSHPLTEPQVIIRFAPAPSYTPRAPSRPPAPGHIRVPCFDEHKSYYFHTSPCR